MRKRYSLGLDCGSTFCKGVLMADGQVVAQAVQPTGWDFRGAARLVRDELLALQPIAGPPLSVVATGYGRHQIEEFETEPPVKAVTEITCHGLGAEYLVPGVRCAIDIGGQDYKIIELEAGKVLSFQMNDRCAAGSGRFLEMVLNRLGVDLTLMDELLAANRSITLNSTCVVFVESEIVGLLAQGAGRAEILGGVVSSLVAKIAAQAARLNLEGPAVLTGGLARSRGLCDYLSRALGFEVIPLANGSLAGAIGAATLAAKYCPAD